MIAVGDKIRDKELDSRKRRLLAAAEIITNKLVQKEIDTDIVGLKDSDRRRDMMAAEIKMDLALINRGAEITTKYQKSTENGFPQNFPTTPRELPKNPFSVDFPYLTTPLIQDYFPGLRPALSLLNQLKQVYKPQQHPQP